MATNPNMVAIQTVTVGAGGASSIEFTSIPQTYTDLKVVFSVRDATNNNGVVKITFNGSATATPQDSYMELAVVRHLIQITQVVELITEPKVHRLHLMQLLQHSVIVNSIFPTIHPVIINL